MANTRQKMAGGVLVGAVALAFYLGTQWNGMGPGGTGTGFGTPTSGIGEEAVSATPDLAGDESAATSQSSQNPASPVPEKVETLTVILSGDQIQIAKSGDLSQVTEADLSQVGHAAEAVPGDAQGIRVRVYHKKDATAGVMDDLKRKFSQLGIAPESVQYMDQPLE